MRGTHNAPLTRVCFQRGPGADPPGQGLRGGASEAETFQHWNVQKKRHFVSFREFEKTTISLNWLSGYPVVTGENQR